MKHMLSILLATMLLIVVVGSAYGQVNSPGTTPVGTVTYVSIEGVYIDAGTGVGLVLGDTLRIQRGGQIIATVVINNISTNASAAVVVSSEEVITAGDQVFSTRELPVETKLDAVTTPTEEEKEPAQKTPGVRYRGNVSFSNYLHSDLTNSDLGWTRPGAATRLTIDNISSAGLRFELRHRSRLYHRSRAVRAGESKDDWSHQVYQMALFNDADNGRFEWGFGRLITPYVRGVGYVDGGYFARKVGDNIKLGAALGTVPDREDGSFSSDVRKAGLFVAYETGHRAEQSLEMSLALSSESKSGTTSRDFIYLQAAYNRGNWLSMFHSTELDYNRHWRYEAEGKRITFTNYFGRATISPNERTRLYLSYDLRKRIRYIETSTLPDSLFDDRDSRGLRGGATIKFGRQATLGLTGGVRFNDNQFRNPLTGTVSLRMNRFPGDRQSMSFYFSYINTEFTTGYRPRILYRFPLTRRLLVNLTGATHIYKTGTVTTTNSYGDIATSYSFSSGMYLSGNLRQYFDSELKALELFTEVGWGW